MVTWAISLAMLGIGAVMFMLGVKAHERGLHQSWSRTTLPTLVLGQVVFLVTSSVVLGLLAFLLALGVTDLGGRSSTGSATRYRSS